MRSPIPEAAIPDIDSILAEIERYRSQVGRQRKEILQLQRAGISTAATETLLQRMLAKIDTLRTQRNKLKAEQRARTKGKFLGGRR
jgi:aspartyl/asparaginyl beta-hydroxylase (cupin superfamily)